MEVILPSFPRLPMAKGFTFPSPRLEFEKDRWKKRKWAAEDVEIRPTFQAEDVEIRPTFQDLVSCGAVLAIYYKWCSYYKIERTSEDMTRRLEIFTTNMIHVYDMNDLEPNPDSFFRFHLSSVCDEKDLFDLSGDEEMAITPAQMDLGTDEAVWDLYYRWCLYHKILRTSEEMQKRFNNFKTWAFYAVKMNQKDPSSCFCMSIWCDKIDLRFSSAVEEKAFTPTKEDIESDQALWDLYCRWCLHHKLRRTPKEMKLAFGSFKKSATHAIEMSQKDPNVQFCLSIWCDETYLYPVHEVTLIPTERDLKSGNALLHLYKRYCLYYDINRTPDQIKQRFSYFKKSVLHVFEMNKTDPSYRFYLSFYCDEKDMLERAHMKVSIRSTSLDFGLYGAACATNEVKIIPTYSDLESYNAVSVLYNIWRLHYKVHRTSEEIDRRFNIFLKNATHVYEMNELDQDPFCQFYMPSFCDEKDLFDPSVGRETTLTPTEKDLETDEAVWDLYYRWCLYHQILRTTKEMQKRFYNFKMSARYAVKMNQKYCSSHFCMSVWCDKIDLRFSSSVGETTLTPTKVDIESDQALWDLYHRWCLHHKLRRTPEEMKLAFGSFKKSATHAFEMCQKDPNAQFCLSIWCDETDHYPVNEVKRIPTERDLKSGNALLGLYNRYCIQYRKHRTPEEMKQRFSNFKRSVNRVFELNKTDPSWPYYLSDCADEKDRLDTAASKLCIIPTFRDLGSDEAVLALYRKWLIFGNQRRTSEEMHQRLHKFKKRAISVFERNIECPGSQALLRCCDEDENIWTGLIL